MDLLEFRPFLRTFDVIHASPPCQGSTTMSNRARVAGSETVAAWPKLIGPVREALLAWGGIYVIENVPGAAREMLSPVTLHGGMFGLGVQRPRLFESNALIMAAPAPAVADPIGVYGKTHDGRRLFTRADGSNQYAASSLEQASAAMGIDWRTWDDLREAIPPAYAQFIGEQLIDQLAVAA
jgi:DNA (cytosine-5)-methyltransferase 1